MPSLLRSRDTHAAVPPEELFFDLVYVFAVTQLSHLLLEHLSLKGALEALILWGGVWLGWQYTVWVTNWFNPENGSVRAMLFGVMLLSLLCAVAIPDAFGSHGWLFGVSFALMEVGRTVWVVANLERDSSIRPNFLRILCWEVLVGALWLIGAFADAEIRLPVWALAVVIQYVAPMTGFRVPGLGRSTSAEWTIDGAHLAERCQLFVIVAIGETIVATGATMARAEHVETATIVAFLVSFIGTLALWWIYFGTSSKDGSAVIEHAGDPGAVGARYHYAHAILVAGIIVCAVGNDLVIAHPDGHIEWKYIAVLYGGPAIYLIGNMLYKLAVYGRVAVSHVIGLALLALTAPLAHAFDLLVSGIWTTLIVLVVSSWDYWQRKRNPMELRQAAGHH